MELMRDGVNEGFYEEWMVRNQDDFWIGWSG